MSTPSQYNAAIQRSASPVAASGAAAETVQVDVALATPSEKAAPTTLTDLYQRPADPPLVSTSTIGGEGSRTQPLPAQLSQPNHSRGKSLSARPLSPGGTGEEGVWVGSIWYPGRYRVVGTISAGENITVAGASVPISGMLDTPGLHASRN
jgi:hypothetical protein